MSKKKVSKRQRIREGRRRQAQMQRFGMIGVVVIGAVLVAAALIYSVWQPPDEIVTVEPILRPMAAGTAMGDPNAPSLLMFSKIFSARLVFITRKKLKGAFLKRMLLVVKCIMFFTITLSLTVILQVKNAAGCQYQQVCNGTGSVLGIP